MPLLLMDAEDVAAALPYEEVVEVLEEGFRAFAAGQYTMPQRTMVVVEDGLLALMPAVDADAMGVKVATIHHGNIARGLPTVQATVLLLDARTGKLRAILDGTVLTVIRTAAASAVATHWMARPGPARLGVLGSGPLARAHVRALSVVRSITGVMIYSPHAGARRAEVLGALKDLDAEVRLAPSPRHVVMNSDLLVLATSSTTPVVAWEWIKPGTHINAVGSHAPGARELDTQTVVNSRVVCDSVEACWREAGDLLQPEGEGALDRSHASIELGDVLLGKVPGRGGPEEVTVFKSVGLAFEDLCVARAAWNSARLKT